MLASYQGVNVHTIMENDLNSRLRKKCRLSTQKPHRILRHNQFKSFQRFHLVGYSRSFENDEFNNELNEIWKIHDVNAILRLYVKSYAVIFSRCFFKQTDC